jgi:hypothetical protein
MANGRRKIKRAGISSMFRALAPPRVKGKHDGGFFPPRPLSVSRFPLAGRFSRSPSGTLGSRPVSVNIYGCPILGRLSIVRVIQIRSKRNARAGQLPHDSDESVDNRFAIAEFDSTFVNDEFFLRIARSAPIYRCSKVQSNPSRSSAEHLRDVSAQSATNALPTIGMASLAARNDEM